VVDSTHARSLATELARLEDDLVGDGWTVTRIEVKPDDPPPGVKAAIQKAYAADPKRVNSVFLFGHVAVPYSGDIDPDAHPEHRGAWPADVHYGDVDGAWTDARITSTSGESARNKNVPGDGKFDQVSPPSRVELAVGRVDLAKMPGKLTYDGPPTFPSEEALLRQYLDKDHAFRHKLFSPKRRALVRDGFGDMNGEAFAASGWRSFSALVGSSAITALSTPGTFIATLQSEDYLWAYGCGGGSPSTIAGLGSDGPYQAARTIDVVNADIRAPFVFLFGSWLGDWDSEDNVLRSVLATKTMGLASAWSGRPHWFVHTMALGETIRGEHRHPTRGRTARRLRRMHRPTPPNPDAESQRLRRPRSRSQRLRRSPSPSSRSCDDVAKAGLAVDDDRDLAALLSRARFNLHVRTQVDETRRSRRSSRSAFRPH
jgi:hypothetical protein